MPIDWDEIIPMPSDADRAARRTDLVVRARRVREEGWDAYQYVWSTGEVVGVALLLDSTAVLEEFNETRETVLSRYAYDLFGMRGGREEEAAGFPQTRAWFLHAQTELAR